MVTSFFGAPAGIRTPDTLLKRQVLCLLSYWGAGARTSHGAALTCWLGWRDSNPQRRSQSPVCYRYTTSHHYIKRTEVLFFIKWGGRWDSNPRHLEPQSSALPTELHPPFIFIKRTMIISAACLLATGTPRGIRTPGLLLRRQLLYPAELLAHIHQRWSGRRESNPRIQLGRLVFYH